MLRTSSLTPTGTSKSNPERGSPSTYKSNARMVCDRYVLGRTLGGGVEGKVKRCLDTQTGKEVAVKIIDMKNIVAHSKQMTRIKNEIKILEHLKHPNIVSLVGFHTNVDYPRKRGGTKKVILIIMELVEGGELFPYLQFTGCFSESICRMFLKQLASALAHCKSNLISHRDIKPENIFLTKDFQVKLGDFGLSAIHEHGFSAVNGQMQPKLLSSYVGTDAYMAPEIIAGHRYSGEAVDVWSLGVVFFIMLSGFPPLQRADMKDWYYKRIVKKQYENFWKAHERSMKPLPATVKDLILKMLHPDPDSRITLEGILSHEFMQKHTESDYLLEELRMRRAAVENELRKERRAQGKVSTETYTVNADSTSTIGHTSNASTDTTGSGALSDYQYSTESKESDYSMDVESFDPYSQDVWRSISHGDSDSKAVKENQVPGELLRAPKEVEMSVDHLNVWLPVSMVPSLNKKDAGIIFKRLEKAFAKSIKKNDGDESESKESDLVQVLKSVPAESKQKLKLKLASGEIVVSIRLFQGAKKRVIAAITRKKGSSLTLQTILQSISLKFRSM